MMKAESISIRAPISTRHGLLASRSLMSRFKSELWLAGGVTRSRVVAKQIRNITIARTP